MPCEMNRNGKRRQNINVSPCKRSLHSSVCRLEQPACCGWRRRRVYCGEGAESKPEPIIPFCLLRLQTAQIPHEAHPAAVALICQSSSSPSLGGGELWYAIQQPSPPLPSSLWSIWSHLLRADLFDHCISESYWVTISTPRRSHFDD